MTYPPPFPIHRLSRVWYFYPIYQRVSFREIAEKHCQQLKKYYRLTTVDLNAFSIVHFLARPLVLIQPYFYPFQTSERKLIWQIPRTRGIIGFDVADSDHLSQYAVKLTRHATALIVPSNHAKSTYVKSGVKKPVYILPHGVDLEYILTPKQNPSTFKPLAEKKQRENLIALQCWIPHSPFRKGFDILINLYKLLTKEHKNLMLIIKTSEAVGYIPPSINYRGGAIEHYMEWRLNKKWITEQEKMELHDLCDIYLLTSRGGGFEHPALEALARGNITLGAKGGSWEEFLPDWALVPSKTSPPPLEGNPIHNGKGVELILEKALEKTLNILNNLNEYKAKVQEHITHVIKQNFTWEQIGKQLIDIVSKYL